jgi:CRP-like cAMP-binding protein
VEVEEGKEPVKLTHGAFFGETAILHEVEREAAVVCDTDCEVLALTKDAVEMVLIQHPGQQHFIQELSESGSTSKLQKKPHVEQESGEHGKSEDKQEKSEEVACASSSQYLSLLKKLQLEENNIEFSNSELAEMMNILTEMTTITALKKTS